MVSDTKRAACATAVALFIGLSLAGVATAGEPSASDREVARGLMAEGRTRLAAKDFNGALTAFKAADSIMHVPTTGLAMANAHLALGQLVSAHDAALRVSRIPVGSNESAAFTEAREAAVELAAQLGPRIPSLRIDLSGPGAKGDVELFVDDAPVARDTLIVPRRLDPGHHVVVAKAGHVKDPVRVEVDLAERDSKSISLEIPSSPRLAGGPVGPASGTAPDATTRRSRSPFVYIGFGLAGAGVAVGSVFGVLSISKKNSAASECRDLQCPPSTYSDLDAAQTNATISTIGFVAAGVGAAIGVVGLLIGTSPASRTVVLPGNHASAVRVTVEPFLSTDARGAGVTGRF